MTMALSIYMLVTMSGRMHPRMKTLPVKGHFLSMYMPSDVHLDPEQCSCSTAEASLCHFLQAGASSYFERWSALSPNVHHVHGLMEKKKSLSCIFLTLLWPELHHIPGSKSMAVKGTGFVVIVLAWDEARCTLLRG